MNQPIKPLKIDALTTDAGTQIRAAIDQATVERYADAMRAGPHQPAPGPLPPVVVFFDGTDYFLADGFHRLRASSEAGSRTIQCVIHPGTLADAIRYAAGANATHGLPRTHEDKRRAVEAVLKLDPKASDRVVAMATATSHTFVARIRPQVATLPPDEPPTRRGKDGKQYPPPAPKPARKQEQTFAQRQDAADRPGVSDPDPGRSISRPAPPVENVTCPWTGGPHEWKDGACALCHEPQPAPAEATPHVAQATSASRADQVATLPPDDPAAEYDRIIAENTEKALALGVPPAKAATYFPRPNHPANCDPRFKGYVIYDGPDKTYYTGRGSRFTDAMEHARLYRDAHEAERKADEFRSRDARYCTVAACYEPDETAADRCKCPTCNGAGKITIAANLPDELAAADFAKLWAEWQAYRKQRKDSLTRIGAARQIKFLAKLGPTLAAESIEQSILHGWTGLFDPREKNRGPKEPAKLTNRGKTAGKVAKL